MGEICVLRQGEEAVERFLAKYCFGEQLRVTPVAGVEVLRIKGLEFPDFSFLESFPDLRVAEFIETTFDTAKDIERLNSLEQLSCYLN